MGLRKSKLFTQLTPSGIELKFRRDEPPGPEFPKTYPHVTRNIGMSLLVLVSVSVAMRKHQDQNQLGEEKVYLSL